MYNIDDHFFESQHESEEELIKELIAKKFNYDIPLVDFHLLNGQQCELIVRFHPCIADPWALTQMIAEHFFHQL
eukprot:UN27040